MRSPGMSDGTIMTPSACNHTAGWNRTANELLSMVRLGMDLGETRAAFRVRKLLQAVNSVASTMM